MGRWIPSTGSVRRRSRGVIASPRARGRFRLGDAAGYVEPSRARDGLAFPAPSRGFVRQAGVRPAGAPSTASGRARSQTPSAAINAGAASWLRASGNHARGDARDIASSGTRASRHPCWRTSRRYPTDSRKDRVMPLHIHGIGTAVPPNAISQEEAAETAALYGCTSPEHQRQIKRSIACRESGSGTAWCSSRTAGPGRRGSRSSLHEGSRRPWTVHADRMGEVRTRRAGSWRQGGEHRSRECGARAGRRHAPCDGILHRLLRPELRPRTRAGTRPSLDGRRTHLGFMGCHGALNGLRVAGGSSPADPDACVLVCAVELCSLHYQYGWNSGSRGLQRDLRRRALLWLAAAAGPLGRRLGARPQRVLAARGFGGSDGVADWEHGFEIALSAPRAERHRARPCGRGSTPGSHRSSSTRATSHVGHSPGGPRILESPPRRPASHARTTRSRRRCSASSAHVVADNPVHPRSPQTTRRAQALPGSRLRSRPRRRGRTVSLNPCGGRPSDWLVRTIVRSTHRRRAAAGWLAAGPAAQETASRRLRSIRNRAGRWRQGKCLPRRSARSSKRRRR